MKIKIVFASRYGSSKEIAGWLAQRFRFDQDITVDIESAEEANSAEGYDLVLLGSGIYSHSFLPELESYIERDVEALKNTKTALFGVAMKTEPALMRGKLHGGLLMLEKYAEQLGKSCIYGVMLHGEMIYDIMTEEDKRGLDKFYKMIGLSEAEVTERKKPRTLMNKAECWEFAEKLMKMSKGAK